MELAKKQSESPLSKTKGRGQEINASDHVGENVEPTKTKKKGHRNKQKSQVNGKENGDSALNGNDVGKDEVEDRSKQTQCRENNKEKCEQIVPKSDLKENVLNNSCEPVEVLPESSGVKDGNNDQSIVKDSSSESANIAEVNAVSVEVVNEINEETDKEDCTSTDLIVTECNAKNVIPLPDNLDLNQSQMNQNESFNTKSTIDVNGVSVSPVNSQNSSELASLEESDIHVNGSNDDSYFEAVDFEKDVQIQASPDTATQDDNSISNKITSFLVRQAPTSSPILQDQKQDSEISSSKKLTNSMILTADGKPIIHPYLSKVTGRPGIRGRSNLSSLDTNGLDGAETPDNRGTNLSDSFRVKTDPPRLNQFEYKENPVLRKFKGKRCLNVNDDYDEGDSMYVTMTKRRKLDDKTSGSGFLGSMLWSPFKKRSINVENSLKLSANQSKLSRFLSPFWFWKKSATTDHHERN